MKKKYLKVNEKKRVLRSEVIGSGRCVGARGGERPLRLPIVLIFATRVATNV
jgi:hypothetical protein